MNIMSTDAVAAVRESRATIVLVHGAFVDGSGWAGVHRILRDQGHEVLVTQNNLQGARVWNR
jgi:hypothetical protein